MKLYHFTCACDHHLGSILRDQKLTTTGANLHILESRAAHRPGDPRVAWLTSQDSPERDHGLQPPSPETLAAMRAYWTCDKTAVRFTLDLPDARRWIGWALLRGMSSRSMDALIATGGGIQSARTWFVVEREIPAAEWLAVETTDADIDLPGVSYVAGWSRRLVSQ